MQATLLALLKKKYPKMVEKWDGWDYRVIGPISLDDPPVVQVLLMNKGKSGGRMQVGLDLAGAVD